MSIKKISCNFLSEIILTENFISELTTVSEPWPSPQKRHNDIIMKIHQVS